MTENTLYVCIPGKQVFVSQMCGLSFVREEEFSTTLLTRSQPYFIYWVRRSPELS